MEKFGLSQVCWWYLKFICADCDFGNMTARSEVVSCTELIFQKCSYNLWVATVFCLGTSVRFSLYAVLSGVPNSLPEVRCVHLCVCVSPPFHLLSYCEFCSLWKLDSWLPHNCYSEQLSEKNQVIWGKNKVKTTMAKLKHYPEYFKKYVLNWNV